MVVVSLFATKMCAHTDSYQEAKKSVGFLFLSSGFRYKARKNGAMTAFFNQMGLACSGGQAFDSFKSLVLPLAETIVEGEEGAKIRWLSP